MYNLYVITYMFHDKPNPKPGYFLFDSFVSPFETSGPPRLPEQTNGFRIASLGFGFENSRSIAAQIYYDLEFAQQECDRIKNVLKNTFDQQFFIFRVKELDKVIEDLKQFERT